MKRILPSFTSFDLSAIVLKSVVACSGRAGRHGNCATSDVGSVDGQP
jgi:hypothetical protein